MTSRQVQLLSHYDLLSTSTYKFNPRGKENINKYLVNFNCSQTNEINW